MKNFFYGSESEMFTFFKIPKLLFSEQYKDISTDAKVLFGLMLDRMGLSAKSENWTDPDGRVYIHFPIQDVMDTLGIANEKATRLYKELENASLIQRERQGLGKPTKIYVCKFFKEDSRKSGIQTPESRNQDSRKSGASVTKIVNEIHESRDSVITESVNATYYETDSNETDSNETEGSETSPPTPPPGGTGETQKPPKPSSRKKAKSKKTAMEPLSQEEQSLFAFSPRLLDTVDRWIRYKTEKKQPYVPQGRQTLLKKIQAAVNQHGPDAMADAIEKAMSNGWQGIVWERIGEQNTYYPQGYSGGMFSARLEQRRRGGENI